MGHGLYEPQNPIGVSRSWYEGRLAGVGTLGKKSITPGQDSFNKAHFIELQQTDIVTPFVNEHLRHLREDNPNRNEAWVAKNHMHGFNTWL